jgi:ABC-2 type transport system permease protein
MNHYWLITKVQLMNIFKQSNRKNNLLHLGSYTIGVLVMAGLGIYYSTMLFSSMEPEAYSTVPMLMAYVATVLIFVMGTSSSRGMLFGFKDLDLLKAMPFTDKEIVFSKLAVFTLTEFAYAGAFFIPVIIIFGIKAGMGILFYLLALLGFIFLPFIPIALSSLIGMGMERLSAGKKHSDLIRNITAVVFFLAIYAGSMYMSFQSDGLTDLGNINSFLGSILLPAKWYMEGALKGQILPVLGFAALSAAVYALFVYFYAKSVMKINALSGQGYHVKGFKVKRVKRNNVFGALVNKEKNRFFKNFLYVFNTAFGMFLLVGGSIYLMFAHNATVAMLSEIIGDDSSINLMMSQLFILVIVMLGEMTCTTSSSISLEGKSLWIMKTLPVTTSQVFWSKMMINILLIIIPSSISLILLGIVFGFQWLYYVCGLAFIAAAAFGISMFGLLMNLAFPKLAYENEQEVIKQSMPAFLGVMVPMFVGILMLMGFFLLGPDMDGLFYIYLAGFAVLDIVMYAILMSAGKKKYNSLS